MVILLVLLYASAHSLHIPLHRDLLPARLLASGSIQLNNYLNVSPTQAQYYANISIGTPPQSLRVIIDTGTAVSYIASTQCDASCGGSARFDKARSSTYKASGDSELTVRYVREKVQGTAGNDSVEIAGLTATDVPIILAKSMQNAVGVQYDGRIVKDK